MKNLIPLKSYPNDYTRFDGVCVCALMGEQNFIIFSSKNQQAFDDKFNKISDKKKYSWRQGLNLN